MHSIFYQGNIFLFQFFEGFIIISTKPKNFAICTAKNCRKVFLTDERDISEVSYFLCPTCRERQDQYHTIQCRSCHTIIDFMEIEPGEFPATFYVDNCTQCNGIPEDELKVTPFMYPKMML